MKIDARAENWMKDCCEWSADQFPRAEGMMVNSWEVGQNRRD